MLTNEDLQFARMAVREGLVSREAIQHCLESLAAFEKQGIKKSLEELMIEEGLLATPSPGDGQDAPVVDVPAGGNIFADAVGQPAPSEAQADLIAEVDEDTSPLAQAEAGQEAKTPVAEKAEDEDEFADLIGKKVGNYKIVGKLGKGGMGVVYRGEDCILDRNVAVKLLPRSLTGGTNRRLVERFFREARAAAQIVHRNIVQVYEMGEDAGCHFIIMEYVDGGSLQELIRKRDPSRSEVVEYIYQAAMGLGAAAEKHIVHRDVKPSNILITTDGVAKIADFGLAKNVASDSDLTYSGQVLGTPHFMSPEQCDGVPTDSRADIYSLGAAFYFALTKRYPYTGETALAVMLKQKTEPLMPPTEHDPTIPKGLCAVVQKMMAKKLSDRYQSFTEVVADIERVRRGQQPDIRPDSLFLTSSAHSVTRAAISVIQGRGKGKVFNLEDDAAVTIGRDSSKSTLALLDAAISRAHCSIRNEDGRFFVEDHNSANGTFVNGERVTKRELLPNDRIQVGGAVLTFRLLPRSKDALQLVRMAYQQGYITRDQGEDAIRIVAEREADGEEAGMAELLLEKGYISPDQAKGLCKQLDQKLKVVIMKQAVPVAAAAQTPAVGSLLPPASVQASASADGAPPTPAAPMGQVPIVVAPVQAVQMQQGLFEGLLFCDQCGEYITDEEIAQGSLKSIGNNNFCSRCIEQSPLLGEILQGYMLWERLGVGRIGQVYRAEALDTQKDICLKIVHKSIRQSPAILERIKAAVDRAAAFRHPNVAPVIDAFQADAEFVVCMPYVGARSLRSALLRETPKGLRVRRMADLDRVVEIVRQTAQALAFAEQVGHPHGELGPEKILLATNGNVKVADIGMATAQLVRGLDVPQIQEHKLLGYLDYRAPELVDGRRPPDARSDLFSLGAIMYTLIAGKRFTAAVRTRDLDREVPRAHAKLLTRLTDPVPDRRYRDAEHLIRDLERV